MQARLFALCLSVPAVLATACDKTVDTKGFENTLRDKVTQMGLTASKVACPGNVKAKKGGVFVCAIEIAGKSYDLEVTITGIDGKRVDMDTKWKAGAMVVTSKLGPALTEELGKQLEAQVAIDCGADALTLLDAKQQARCALTPGAAKRTVVITFDDKLVPTGWVLEPARLGRGKLEAVLAPSVKGKLGPEVAVTCGTDSLLMRPDDGFVMCDIGDGKQAAKIKVEVDKDLNVQRWDVVTPTP